MENNKLSPRHSGFAFLIGFLIFQLGAVVITSIGIIIGNFIGESASLVTNFFYTGLGYIFLAVGVDIFLVLTFIFFNRKSNNKIISKPNFYKVIIYSLLAIATFFILAPVINLFDYWFLNLGLELTRIPYELNLKNYLLSIISMVVAPAICEELLFRGLIFKGLKPIGKVFSIIMSALMFALFHMSANQFLYPLLMGLIFGVIMYHENNILYCITIHLINNFLSLTFYFLGISLFTYTWWFILIAFILLGMFLALVIPTLFKNKTPREKFKKEDKFTFFACFGLMCLLWIIIVSYSFIKIL